MIRNSTDRALETARQNCLKKNPGTAEEFTQCMKEEIDRYYDGESHNHMLTLQQAPYRINAAALTGLSTLARIAHPAGGMLGVVTGVGLAGVGALELTEGIKSKDARTRADALFNIATGGALVAGAFAGLPVALAAPVLVLAKEVYLRN